MFKVVQNVHRYAIESEREREIEREEEREREVGKVKERERLLKDPMKK